LANCMFRVHHPHPFFGAGIVEADPVQPSKWIVSRLPDPYHDYQLWKMSRPYLF
jgi:hypothetical protein